MTATNNKPKTRPNTRPSLLYKFLYKDEVIEKRIRNVIRHLQWDFQINHPTGNHGVHAIADTGNAYWSPHRLAKEGSRFNIGSEEYKLFSYTKVHNLSRFGLEKESGDPVVKNPEIVFLLPLLAPLFKLPEYRRKYTEERLIAIARGNDPDEMYGKVHTEFVDLIREAVAQHKDKSYKWISPDVLYDICAFKKKPSRQELGKLIIELDLEIFDVEELEELANKIVWEVKPTAVPNSNCASHGVVSHENGISKCH